MHGIMRAKDGHRNVNFRYVVGPDMQLPTKIMPLSYSPAETDSLMDLGERDAERSIYNLLYKTEEEITNRIHSSLEIRYYNKERQQKHEESMRAVFNKFMAREIHKVELGKQKKLDEIANKQARQSPKHSSTDKI